MLRRRTEMLLMKTKKDEQKPLFIMTTENNKNPLPLLKLNLINPKIIPNTPKAIQNTPRTPKRNLSFAFNQQSTLKIINGIVMFESA